MLEWSPVPYAFERGHLVVASALPGLHRQAWICTDRDWQYVVLLLVVFRDCEAFHGCQFVVGIERRRVAARASLPAEDLLSACGQRVELVRIRGRAQRVKIKCQREELFITVAFTVFRWVPRNRYESVEGGKSVNAKDRSGVTHHITGAAMLHQTCPIKIFSIGQADQVAHHRRITRAGTVSGDDSRRYGVVESNDFLARQRIESVEIQPRNAEISFLEAACNVLTCASACAE